MNTALRRGLIALLVAGNVAAFAAERVEFAEIRSAALGRTLPLAIVSSAAAARKDGPSPVLFVLHGRGRNHRSLIDADAARAALLDAPFYLVLPQGEDGWYIDSPARPTDRYNAYLEEVIAWAEEKLPVSREPRYRGIAGWSMGGFGAVRFAESHPGKFGFVASVIGLLDFPREENLPEGQNYKVPRDRFTSDPEVWARLNPLHSVAALRGSAVTLVLATRGFERTMNENFLAALRSNQLSVNVHTLEGGHEFSLVERALPLLIADAAKAFGVEP